MQVWTITDPGVVRQQNQDNCLVFSPSEDRCFVIVCDGMGGAKAGNIASQLAVEGFVSVLKEEEGGAWAQQPQEVLTRCVQVANEMIFRRSITDPDCEGMGTTVVAALIAGEKACILNVGDSRAYFINEEEGIRRITRDHSFVEDLLSKGEISPEAARVHPQKNLITKALGVLPEVKSDFYEVELHEGDHILLCSDGLSNLMDDQEISYEVLYGGPSEECCERLLKLSISRGAPDNVTVALLRV